ncbi:hypothetical protein LCGC14_1860070 [marine sediment metagenome]|uniref:Uncharacterized protein n=1 Tax=marine sediment metagenome TaxID=412755 RepID=A0A0F9G7P4_9ZZZZ
MATGAYEGDVYTLQDDAEIGTFPNAAIAGGLVYCTRDRVTALTATGLTLGSTFHVAKLPKGAVVLYSIVYPIATATFDAPDATSAATTGVLGVTGDTDLFGDVTTLGSATPQVVIPKPDGTTQTDSIQPLTEAKDVFLTSAAQDHTTAEGFAVMMFYTIAGRSGA